MFVLDELKRSRFQLTTSDVCTCISCRRPQWLQELSALVAGCDVPLVLSLPCVGVSSPIQACSCLGVPAQGVEIADLESALEPVLRRHHPGQECLLGPVHGDIARTCL